MDNDWSVFKYLLIIFSPLFCFKFLNDAEYIFALYCIIPWVMLIVNVYQNWTNNTLDFEYTNPYAYDNYSTNTVNTFWVNKEKELNKTIEDIGNKCVINHNIIKMDKIDNPNLSIKLLPIKEYVAKELSKKEKNIIEITKKDKPIVDMNKVLQQTSISQSNNNISGNSPKSAILVENDDKLSSEQLLVYNTIIKVLEEKCKFILDEKYCLYQSFAHIDVFKEGVVIYLDFDILKKGKLSITDIHQEDIVNELKKTFNNKELKVIFDEYKTKKLLNYFLELNKYGTRS